MIIINILYFLIRKMDERELDLFIDEFIDEHLQLKKNYNEKTKSKALWVSETQSQNSKELNKSPFQVKVFQSRWYW